MGRGKGKPSRLGIWHALSIAWSGRCIRTEQIRAIPASPREEGRGVIAWRYNQFRFIAYFAFVPCEGTFVFSDKLQWFQCLSLFPSISPSHPLCFVKTKSKTGNNVIEQKEVSKKVKTTAIGAFLFGVGIIGMLDGIVFHQILQWHSVNMHTDRVHQIISDGLFHLFVTVMIFLSGIMLWKGNPQDKPSIFWGYFLLGAGIFNLFEGIINHHILQLHHVRPGPNQTLYDISYDVFAILLLTVGLLFIRHGKKT